MIRVQLLVVGKLRERWLQKGVEEYTKRLRRLASVKTLEIPDQPCPDNGAEQMQAIQKEGAQILARINPRSHIIALDVKGTSMDSLGLAKMLADLSVTGVSDISFVIGGSMGLSQEVLNRADLRLSFSAFTFPHQLMRVVLLEQIYRACKINAGET